MGHFWFEAFTLIRIGEYATSLSWVIKIKKPYLDLLLDQVGLLQAYIPACQRGVTRLLPEILYALS